MHQRFIFLFFSLFCLSSYANNLSSDELTKIEKKCQQSSPECLSYLAAGLSSSKAHSRQWFRFKQLRLFNLFDLQKWSLLRKELDNWLLVDDIPPNFAVYVYIYHAKLNLHDQDDGEFTRYLTKATDILNEINSNYFSPLRLIEIANLQISLKNYSQAKQTLLQLDKKFSKRDYPLFKQELYANLGHIALQQKKYDEHVYYRIKSLNSTLKTPNKQQIAIAYANLARAYQVIEQLKKAKENYKLSINYSQSAKDINTTIRSQMRLTQVLISQGNKTQAKKMFSYLSTHFNDKLTAEGNQALYQTLNALLSISK